MNFHSFRSTRRAFLEVGGCNVLAAQLGAVSSGAAASELTHLNETDAAADALGYVHQADTVSAEKRVDATHVCGNSRFYTAGGDGRGPGALFSGNAVAAQGWYQVRAAKL